MLKSCKYCGKVHPRKYVCPMKPKKKWYAKTQTEVTQFRSSQAWRMKSLEIRKRDNYLCQICIRLLYDTTLQYTFDKLEVHHIRGVLNHWGGRLDNSNLITLCCRHHKMADDGTIHI